MRNKIFFLVSSILIIGCTYQDPGPYGPNYYYGNYLYSLDNYKKNLTLESEEELINSLRQIISESKEYDVDLNTEVVEWRVPPGICAELGYRLAKKGELKEADELYDLELRFYPESAVLITKLKKQLKSNSSE